MSELEGKSSNYTKLLKNRDFRLLMMSQAVSNTGDWLIIGILLVVIGSLSGTSSALAISGLWIAKMLPIIFTPVIGTLVDTVDRKKGMIISDLSRGFLIALVPFFVKLNSLFLIYLVIFISESFTLFFVPAKDASIPDLVKKEELLNANSLSFSINQITMFIGLALGTTIVLVVDKILMNVVRIANNHSLTIFLHSYGGSYAAIFVDALTFLISAFLIYRIAFPKPEKRESKHYRDFYHDIAESIRYLMVNKKIRGLIVSAGFAIFGLGTILVIGPEYADKALHMGKEGFLPLLTILSLGLLTGAVATGFLTKYISKESLFTISLFGLGLSLMALSLFPVFVFAIFLSLIAGFLLGAVYVSAYTLMHENLSESIRGRIFTTLEADIRLAVILSALITAVATAGIRSVKIGGALINGNSSKIILFSGGLIVTFAALYAFNFVYRSIHFNHEKTEITG